MEKHRKHRSSRRSEDKYDDRRGHSDHRSAGHRRSSSTSPQRGHRHRDKEYTLRELKEKARNQRSSYDQGSRRDFGHKRHSNDRRFDDHRRNPSRSRSPRPHQRHRPANAFEHRNENSSRERPKTAENANDQPKEPAPEIRPNFELTGALARDTNTFNGIVIKYNEPPEAKKPSKHWRLYPFKGSEALEHINVHGQSAYLFGRERRVADIPIDHPSCSKQHAVLQYRAIEEPIDQSADDETGGGHQRKKRIRPYLIDLDSANGTYINHQKIEPRRYVELFEKDVIKFGFSTREYVLLHAQSGD